MNRLSTVIATLSLVCLPSLVAAEDWPGWRGPRGDGISLEPSAPIHWSSSRNIAWKTPIPGNGRSSPIVIGSKVFVTTGEDSEETRSVVCLNADDGKILWKTPVHRGPAGKMHKFNTMASSTPTADADRVYAAFNDDKEMRVVALDHGGKIEWSITPGTFYSNHGFAACPVLYGDGVIVNGHQDGTAFVVMLERTSGKELWRYSPSVNIRSFSTPVLTTLDGEDHLVLTGSTQTVGLNPKTGELIWSAEGPSEKFVCTPSVGHGMVFSFAGSPDKKAMAVRLGGKGNVTETHVAWRSERAMPYVPSPLLVGDYLHVVNDGGIYSCLDPKTGKVLTTLRKFSDVNSSPVSVAGKVYFFEDSGRCTIIENGADFNTVATNELGELVFTTPAISHRSLFVRTQEHLIRISDSATSPSDQ